MDSFYLDSVRAEKADAMVRYRVLRNAARLFRFGEAGLILFLVSWISARFPFAVRISGEYLRQLASVAVSPLFVFFLGNAIVVTLLAKSGQFSAGSSATPGVDLCEKSISDGECDGAGNRSGGDLPQPSDLEEMMFEDKQTITEEIAAPLDDPSPDLRDAASGAAVRPSKAYRRSRSENLERESPDSPERPCGKVLLRRSETGISRKGWSSCDDPAERFYPEDELSNEEFQRTIEAFIARQLKFQREESLSIILQRQS